MIWTIIDMVTIYCIEDINDLKYVGSTKSSLGNRLSQHRWEQNNSYGKCSSCKLNLYNCIIYSLETCNESERKDREKYWIHTMVCVNIIKYDFNNTEYLKEYLKKYRVVNSEKLKQKNKEYYMKKK